MLGYLKLRMENERLRLENEQLKSRLAAQRRAAKQWENLFSYTGKPQEDLSDDQD